MYYIMEGVELLENIGLVKLSREQKETIGDIFEDGANHRNRMLEEVFRRGRELSGPREVEEVKEAVRNLPEPEALKNQVRGCAEEKNTLSGITACVINENPKAQLAVQGLANIVGAGLKQDIRRSRVIEF